MAMPEPEMSASSALILVRERNPHADDQTLRLLADVFATAPPIAVTDRDRRENAAWVALWWHFHTNNSLVL